MKKSAILSVVMLLAVSGAFALWFGGQTAEAQERPRKVTKTDREWQKILTPMQYQVTRLKATEPAFSNKYASNHAKGLYACVCCGADLFSSVNKFESGTGWPSFWRPIDPRRIDTAPDYHMLTPRIEVMCLDCGAHLGHVFDDGPPPTGLRFCLNSASLSFKSVAAIKAMEKEAKEKAAKEKDGEEKTDAEESPTPTDGPEPEAAP